MARGASVAILDLSPDTAPEGTIALRCDVSDSAAVDQAVAQVAEQLGGLDVGINNARIGAQGGVTANDDAEWARALDISVRPVSRVAPAASAWRSGLPQRVLSSASKGAIHSMPLAMAADWAREGIRVNAVVPGTANTPWVGRLLEAADDPVAERKALEARQAHGRLVEPEEVAEAHCYLASPRNRSTTGVLLTVDGGTTSLRVRSGVAGQRGNGATEPRSRWFCARQNRTRL